ncbi:sugar phosphate nucleotidyltransferase [Clostridium botulinum]|uniref:sugar phosphate nucleotidyltransferase n=1 Tax=Clostridium botulinum TaxID=1491 RepID=UPI000772DFF7|nr:sugar phosphate nucleotidyltransferase [Clostridium botulinum]MBY6811894.1 CBS domain-containing protein [Clostridium botulinum]MBY6825376.1 CBS domain-containing protein [Clostridium botulinum]MBY6835731.1 CBS domain-containing protein [Clostridium botulinum]MBY6974410.1 CBS domain-containing protein [Clostridium botulinum]NFH78561.1 CBS domain-containing protein [Clostridium botulinum]
MDISSLLVNKDMSIRKGIDILDKNGKKFIVVVEDKKLIGVVTDGDIRRWILKNGDISKSTDNIMTKSPKYLQIEERNNVKEIMNKYKIEAVPIVNKEKEVVDVVFWSDVYNNQLTYFETNNIPIVIMAGGKGTRLQPYTKIIPKMLVPIGEIPIIERIINNFVNFNFNDFYVTINYKKDIIKAYFNKETSYDISFVEEDTPLGTAGSLTLLKDNIKSTFFVSNCDILVDANYSDILKFHKKCQNKITIVTALKNYVIPYGVFNLNDDGSILSLDEKPRYEFLVNTGMYILEKDVLEYIEENKYADMTDIIYKLIENKEKIGIYPVTEGAWLDMGEFESMKHMIDKLV